MKVYQMNVTRLLLLGLLIGGAHLIHARSVAALTVPQTGIIVDIQPRERPGQLKVSRKRSETPVNGAINMQVRRGEVLILAKEAKATVVCDGDAKKHPLRPNASQACPCSAGPRVKPRGLDIVFNPRTGQDTATSDSPVIISPRGTQILNNHPRLRWSAVSASAADNSTAKTVYSVSIYTVNKKLIWSREGIQENEMAYPSNEPALVPGVYMLEVRTSTHSSDEEHWPRRGFTVLPTCPSGSLKSGAPQCLAQRVHEEEARIREMNLPDDSTRLLLAKLYADNKLYAEAIEEMERVAETVRTPTVISQLGNLYSFIGLNREAVNLYLQALSLPAMADDPKVQASTLYSLGLSYAKLADLDQARAKYDKAIKAYRKLGDKKMVMLLTHQRP